MAAHLWELNRRRREHEDLMRRVGRHGGEDLSGKAALEEASAMGHDAVSGSAGHTLPGEPERAVASSSADEDGDAS
jgi:hypothetical protein